MKKYTNGKTVIELDEIQASVFMKAGWKLYIEETVEETVEEVVEEAPAEEAETASETISEAELTKKNKSELLDLAYSLGIKTSMNASKADLINAIRVKIG